MASDAHRRPGATAAVATALVAWASAWALAGCGELEDGALEHALAGWTPSPAVSPDTFVTIPAGTFTMGSPASEPDRDGDETQHEVVLTRSFELQATEVTQGQWDALMGTNPSHFSSCGADCPVERVTWYEALAYCNALSRDRGRQECYALTGCDGAPGTGMRCDSVTFVGLDCQGYRLPTEAEWEYAARAGTTSAWHNGNDASAVAGIAWYYANSGRRTHVVATRAPNDRGLYDVAGNVWEWCWDGFGSYSTGTATDPLGDEGGTYRVRRGGSWSFDAWVCRAANRGYGGPGFRNDYLGFRLARSLP
jgi:formylglycine-generating enzyme required for sulfatase activity